MWPCGDENLGFELIPLRMTVVMFTTILSWLKHMHVWGQQNHHIFPDHRNIPQNLKKNISVTYHLKITQVYPNRISKISSKHSKHHWPRLELSVAPWTLRRSASRCSACEPDPLEKAKTEDPKGPRENDLHMVGPWESQVGDHSLMNCWIYEVYSQWDLRVYIIVSVVWLPVVGFIDCWDKHDRTII